MFIAFFFLSVQGSARIAAEVPCFPFRDREHPASFSTAKDDGHSLVEGDRFLVVRLDPLNDEFGQRRQDGGKGARVFPVEEGVSDISCIVELVFNLILVFRSSFVSLFKKKVKGTDTLRVIASIGISNPSQHLPEPRVLASRQDQESIGAGDTGLLGKIVDVIEGIEIKHASGLILRLAMRAQEQCRRKLHRHKLWNAITQSGEICILYDSCPDEAPPVGFFRLPDQRREVLNNRQIALLGLRA
jgi:hypothetical protein